MFFFLQHWRSNYIHLMIWKITRYALICKSGFNRAKKMFSLFFWVKWRNLGLPPRIDFCWCIFVKFRRNVTEKVTNAKVTCTCILVNSLVNVLLTYFWTKRVMNSFKIYISLNKISMYLHCAKPYLSDYFFYEIHFN